jgi:putative membrane protein
MDRSVARDPPVARAGERQTDETLRIHQANERTLLAWVRTSLGLMGFGFAIARFGLFLRELAESEHGSVRPAHALGSSWAGVALVAIGLLASLAGTLRYGQVRRAIERGEVGAPNPVFVYIVGLTVASVGLGLTVMLGSALLH